MLLIFFIRFIIVFKDVDEVWQQQNQIYQVEYVDIYFFNGNGVWLCIIYVDKVLCVSIGCFFVYSQFFFDVFDLFFNGLVKQNIVGIYKVN